MPFQGCAVAWAHSSREAVHAMSPRNIPENRRARITFIVIAASLLGVDTRPLARFARRTYRAIAAADRKTVPGIEFDPAAEIARIERSTPPGVERARALQNFSNECRVRVAECARIARDHAAESRALRNVTDPATIAIRAADFRLKTANTTLARDHEVRSQAIPAPARELGAFSLAEQTADLPSEERARQIAKFPPDKQARLRADVRVILVKREAVQRASVERDRVQTLAVSLRPERTHGPIRRRGAGRAPRRARRVSRLRASVRSAVSPGDGPPPPEEPPSRRVVYADPNSPSGPPLRRRWCRSCPPTSRGST